MSFTLRVGAVMAGALLLTACAHGGDQASGGTGTFPFGKRNPDKAAAAAPAGIGVNAFLWRASLDTLSFMPLASADPFGGVIITDWYQPQGAGGERFKATAYILSRELRADALRIAMFRQVEQKGQWVDAPMAPGTVSEIENRVLSRARTLRAQGLPNS